MRPFTLRPFLTERYVSTGTSDVQTITPPSNASSFLLTVETTSARFTFDGTDPSVVSAPSHVVPKDQAWMYAPIGKGAFPKFCSATAGSSVAQFTWLT